MIDAIGAVKITTKHHEGEYNSHHPYTHNPLSSTSITMIFKKTLIYQFGNSYSIMYPIF